MFMQSMATIIPTASMRVLMKLFIVVCDDDVNLRLRWCDGVTFKLALITSFIGKPDSLDHTRCMGQSAAARRFFVR